jgi:hypothetical protein
MNSMLKTMAQSVLQDGATVAAGYFAAHGLIRTEDEQSLIGSLVFIGMLVLNFVLRHNAAKKAA